MKKVIVSLDRKGRMTVRTEGYVGESCKQASEHFERLGRVTEDVPTEEMYSQVEQIQGLEIDQNY